MENIKETINDELLTDKQVKEVMKYQISLIDNEPLSDKDLEIEFNKHKFYYYCIASYFYKLGFPGEILFFYRAKFRLKDKIIAFILKEVEYLKVYCEFLEVIVKKDSDFKKLSFQLCGYFSDYINLNIWIKKAKIKPKNIIKDDLKIIERIYEMIDGTQFNSFYEIRDLILNAEYEKAVIFHNVLDTIKNDLLLIQEHKNKAETKILDKNRYYLPNVNKNDLEKYLYELNTKYELNATLDIKALLTELTQVKNKILDFISN